MYFNQLSGARNVVYFDQLLGAQHTRISLHKRGPHKKYLNKLHRFKCYDLSACQIEEITFQASLHQAQMKIFILF